jgi:hypothetical protein
MLVYPGLAERALPASTPLGICLLSGRKTCQSLDTHALSLPELPRWLRQLVHGASKHAHTHGCVLLLQGPLLLETAPDCHTLCGDAACLCVQVLACCGVKRQLGVLVVPVELHDANSQQSSTVAMIA